MNKNFFLAKIGLTSQCTLLLARYECNDLSTFLCIPNNTICPLRKTDHKTWMLKVRIVFGNIKYVQAYDL